MKNKLKLTLSVSLVVLAVLYTASVNNCKAQPRPVDPAAAPQIDGDRRAEIIDSVCVGLNEVYVFPEAALEMEQLLKRKLKDKEYDTLGNLFEFTRVLTQDMRSITNDRHLGVRWIPERDYDRFSASDSITPEQRLRMLEEAAYENFGYQKLERLSGNIGYVDLRGFYDATFGGGKAIAAMNFLSDCGAIIFDLRQNGGGSPSMIQLLSSYFFEEPVHLNSFYMRAEDTVKQFWTQAYVEGPKLTDVDLYILTSDYTFSAAEEFTYNMKNLERATIIGETTGGGAHPVETRFYPNLGIALRVPFGRAINPISGTNWEGTGIEPHIQVPQEEALEVAHIEAMKKLAEKEEHPEIKRKLEWSVGTKEALRNPADVPTETLRSYAGKYGPRTITFEDGELYYQRVERSKYKMIPMNENTFVFKELDFFRLKVVKDENGTITHLEGHYSDGRIDTSPKDGS